MEEEFKLRLETLPGDYDLFGQGRIKDLSEYELRIPTSPEDVSSYRIQGYDDPYIIIGPERYDKELSLNIIQPPEERLIKNNLYNYEPLHHYEKNMLPSRSLVQLITQTVPSKRDPLLGTLPASLLSGGNALQPFGSYLDLGSTKPEDLPEMALPILEFMDDVQPHIVIGCDRGGRLFSLAMHAAWRHTRDGQPFPTLDGKLHFARISKSEDPDVLQEKIDEIVEASKRLGEQRGNELAEDEQLRVLFVDDWVIGGGTMRLAQRLMKKYDAQTYFAVMCGGNADATGKRDLHTHVSWHDRPEEIGVNYLSSIRDNPDGTVTQKQEVIAVRGIGAIYNRQQIQAAAKQLAHMRVLAEVA